MHEDKYMSSEHKDDDERKEEEDLLKNIDNYKTTETDMFFEYFANKDKMQDNTNIRTFDPDRDHIHESDHARDHDRDDRTHDTHEREHQMHDDRDTNGGDQRTDNHHDYGAYFRDTHDARDSRDTHDSRDSRDSRDSETHQSEKPKSPYEFDTEEDEMHAKLEMLRKLGEMAQHGVKLSQNYNMNSSYKTMKWEYELHKSIRDKHKGTKWLSNMLLNICYGLEMGNEKFNPVDFHLKGWTEQMTEDIDDYYDVLGELYEKYFKSGNSMSPELRILFMLSGSAIKFHMQHSLLNSVPNIGSFIQQNPHLAEQMRNDAINDQVKDQYQKQRAKFTDRATAQHTAATQKAADVSALRELRTVGTIQEDQLAEQQRYIEELQQQLAMQRSETGSLYENQRTMQRPPIPPSFRGPIPTTSDPQETYRQQQILLQKQAMAQQEAMRQFMQDKIHVPETDEKSEMSEASTINKDGKKPKKPRRSRQTGTPKVNV